MSLLNMKCEFVQPIELSLAISFDIAKAFDTKLTELTILLR